MHDPLPVRLDRVSKRFGRVQALDAVDLEVRPGETLAILGPNGAGKSTALGILLGLLSPDEGNATLFGCNPRRYASRRRVGAMLQIGSVPAVLTVRELIDLFSTYYPRPLGTAAALERGGATAFADRRFGRLSGGQRQRALFALALCGDPDVLVLDEPTNALDVEARRSLWYAIRTYVREGRSVVLATHDLTEAERIGDRVAILRSGRVAATGSVAAIVERSGETTFENAVLALAGIARPDTVLA